MASSRCLHRLAARSRRAIRLRLRAVRGPKHVGGILFLGVVICASRLGAQTPLGDWSIADIGPPVTESATFEAGCFHIQAVGGPTRFWRDNAAFVFKPLAGDGGIEIRHAGIDARNRNFLPVSIQCRESLAEGSRNAALGAFPGLRIDPIFRARDRVDQLYSSAPDSTIGPIELPALPDAWLRLERRGDFVAGLWSPDRSRWHMEAEHEFPTALGDSILAELVVAGETNPVSASACDGRIFDAAGLLPLPRIVIDTDAAATGEPVRFDATDTLPGGNPIARYQWTFGDGSTAEGRIVSHTFARAGEHDLRLIVTDAAGTSVVVARRLPVEKSLDGWRARDFESAYRFAWSLEQGCHQLTVGGIDLWFALDAVNFTYKRQRGDFILEAQIKEARGNLLLAGLGLMVLSPVRIRGNPPVTRHW